jgi:hypothetical protein
MLTIKEMEEISHLCNSAINLENILIVGGSCYSITENCFLVCPQLVGGGISHEWGELEDFSELPNWVLEVLTTMQKHLWE